MGHVSTSGADRGLPASAVERGLILEALTQLSVDHRQVLLECQFRGKSVAKAAAELGISPATVKSRVYYALRAFQLALDELAA